MTMVCTKLLAYNLPLVTGAPPSLLYHQASPRITLSPPSFFSSSSSSIFAFNSCNPLRSRTSRVPSFSPSPPPSPSSSNRDDDGVVQNMESYLADLSLEYESVWDTKPAWCKPWTIVLTGLVAILGSWLALNSVFATALVTAVIAAWWFIFLYSYPQAYSEMIAERRKRIIEGDEDTFGVQTTVK